MDTDDVDHFDPQFAIDLLLEISQEQSLDQLLSKLAARILERPSIARVRIWLIDRGDRCLRCSRRPQCPDQTRCLHAVASASRTPTSSDNDQSITDHFARIPLGVGVVGKIGATGLQSVLSDLDQDPGELSYIPWLAGEGIRGFNGMPIISKGEVLGVIAVFSRANVPEAAKVWSRIFANHVAGAIASARSFDEIQRLKAQLEQHNTYLREEVVEAKAFGDLIGQSAALGQIVSQIDLVAPTDASVLILGETGTGKELVAHEIHRRSRRADRPLIRVNCASIPSELYESEFFGHAKGAFTGAIRDRAGRFEAAEGGTLFLDEIGEVPLELQGKLLRALQERRYERVGEDRTREANVRIVAATNRDLKREVSAGRFREDLYYRLNVFPIQVAPLRDRPDDIAPLAQHFIHLSVKEMRCERPRLVKAAIQQLQAYAWPGNIRELRNVIERAVILARGGVLTFDLPTDRDVPPKASAQAQTPHTGDDQHHFLTERQVRERERANLLLILEHTGWRIKGPEGAAELLGIKATTLISRIKAMGLQRAGEPVPKRVE
jgi:transcriptional regulator with GAF, ATPase, and Fis domain